MFSAAKLNNCMLQSFLTHSVTLLDVLQSHQQKAAKGGEQFIDVQSLFYRFTMDAIMEIGFGVQLDSLKAEQPPAFVDAFDRMQEEVMWRLFQPDVMRWVQKLLQIRGEKRMSDCLRVINNFVYGIVAARKAGAEDLSQSEDLLSLFIADAMKQKSAHLNDKGADPSPVVAGGLSDEELRDLVLNFMIAGRDTTASLLTFLSFELSSHPEVERLVLEEIEEVFGKVDLAEAHNNEACTRGIDHESLKRAIYLEAVILETLRLHPPVAIDTKTSVRACTFPDGSHIPAGRIVGYSPYCFGRSKAIWGEDVMEFKPQRFLSNEGSSRVLVQPSQYSFPQFNAGFRLCLGKSMAINEAKVVVASVLRRFKLRMKAGHDPHYKVTVVLAMKHGLPVSVKDRQ
jgi:cytochrome P450